MIPLVHFEKFPPRDAMLQVRLMELVAAFIMLTGLRMMWVNRPLAVRLLAIRVSLWWLERRVIWRWRRRKKS